MDLLLFDICGRRYGIDLAAVRRVVRMVEIVPLAEAPPTVCGVVNFRGEIVPVIDMRRRCGFPPREPQPSDVLILVDARGGRAALPADAVAGVEPLTQEEMVPLEGVVPEVAHSQLVGRLRDETVVIYDLDGFLSDDEVAAGGVHDPS
ncbi:MAG TPA: chemotaxis protein CheW [Verrucomicrobiae bacterium]|nr:chemotaxis protein CheW [Verrucomicrobiae bacterium]